MSHDDGPRDARRHHERLKREISERLKERIGEEELITAGPDRRIRVPVKGQREYRFIFDRGRSDGVSQGGDGAGNPGAEGSGSDQPGAVEYEVELDMDEVETILFDQLGLPRLAPRQAEREETDAIYWDDRARKGALLDKKATLRNNFRRNASAGHSHIGGIDREDVRYLTYRDSKRPKSQAVVFLLMDVSGSMGAFEKRVARLFFWWSSRFLRRRYRSVELVFIAHHSEAMECDEHQFFSRVESGGTRCSTAYELALNIQRHRFPAADWNIYVIHCSDGDNFADDNARLIELLTEVSAVANLIGYVQIDRAKRYHWAGEHVYGLISTAQIDRVASTFVSSDAEIWPALKKVFAPSDAELVG